MGKKQEIKKETINRLKIIKEVDRYRSPKGVPMRQVYCKCVCGNFGVYVYSQIKSGKVKSCGCLRDEKLAKRRKTHGQSNTKMYKIWASMRQRCNNINSRSYKRYGGRGIKVDDRWNIYKNFYKDMSAGYRSGMTIERVDNNGDYCKENCIWIEAKKQAKNTRRSVKVVYFGKEHIVSDLEKKLGLSKDYLACRLRKGLTINQAINIKKNTKFSKKYGK